MFLNLAAIRIYLTFLYLWSLNSFNYSYECKLQFMPIAALDSAADEYRTIDNRILIVAIENLQKNIICENYCLFFFNVIYTEFFVVNSPRN